MAESVFDLAKDFSKKLKSSLSRLITPSGKCAVCKTVTDPDEMFCSQSCGLCYWTRYRKSHQVCGYPDCGKPCFVDANKTKVLDFCGRTHASQYKELVKQISPQGPSWSQTCGYSDCTKPCYVDHANGFLHKFCGQTHAAQYKQLENGGPVFSSAHQGAVFTSRIHNNASARMVTGPIYFYNSYDPYYEFTNFYECSIEIDNKKWRSSEHYFQAQKFVGTPYMEVISKLQRPRDAFDLSRNPAVSQWLRGDWETVKLDVMYKALLAKFSQHEDLKFLLLQTGNKLLIEHTWNDSYWGDGGDRRGQNNLGKLLMRVRMVLTTNSVATDGDDPNDRAGDQSNVRGNDDGCCEVIELSDVSSSDCSWKDDNSMLAWSECDEEQLSQYPLEDLIDLSDQDKATSKSAANFVSSVPSSVKDEKNDGFIPTDKKPALSGINTKGSSTEEPMESDN